MFIPMNFSMVGVTVFNVTVHFVQEDVTTKCVVEIVEMLRRGETPPVSLINILYSFIIFFKRNSQLLNQSRLFVYRLGHKIQIVL